jgi:serine/threonine protein kinase
MTAAAFERLNAALGDRYRLEREIGAGGMATVYLAEDLRHHRRVALKVLKPELTEVLGAERFLKEIRSPRTSSTRTSSRSLTPAKYALGIPPPALSKRRVLRSFST